MVTWTVLSEGMVAGSPVWFARLPVLNSSLGSVRTIASETRSLSGYPPARTWRSRRSDRSSQYAAGDYRGTLKTELVHQRDAARRDRFRIAS
jgi:hypothetical protein